MLSDHERRALEELERCYAIEAREPDRPGRANGRSARRPNRPPGSVVLVVAAGLAVALFLVGVPAAAFAWALATVIGWSFWRLSPSLRAGWTAPAAEGADSARPGPDRRPGESIRRYLRWLSEAE